MNKKPRIILAFDTAMNACSVSLYDSVNTQALAEKHEPMNRGQAERLIPMIDEVVKDAAISYQNIDLITCTHGPGAFTGLRLSLATAKALSLSLNSPCIGISTLQAVYHSSSRANKARAPIRKNRITSSYEAPRNNEKKNTLVCLETKRKDFYTQVFDQDGKALTEPKSSKIDEVINLIEEYKPVILGDANERLLSSLLSKGKDKGEGYVTHEIPYPDCTALARIATDKFVDNEPRLQNMKPLYLRDADVSFPATKK